MLCLLFCCLFLRLFAIYCLLSSYLLLTYYSYYYYLVRGRTRSDQSAAAPAPAPAPAQLRTEASREGEEKAEA